MNATTEFRNLSVADNGINEAGEADMYKTTLTLDIEGNQVEVTDARNNVVMQYTYNMLGMAIHSNSMDTGQRWMLNNIAGNPLILWDERDHELTFTYDELQRPVAKHIYGGDIEGVTLDNVYEKIIYGDYLGMADEERLANENINVIGKAQIVYDTAGKTESGQFDFKGNLLRSNRRVCTDYKNTVNWNVDDPDSLLETETFTSEMRYDALNRVVRSVSPDGSTALPTYNEANLLDKVDVVREGEQKAYVKNIDYNEKGQRTAITYGNDVTTTYEYDRETFRLVHLCTERRNESVLQDLYYTYDPVGNITHIRDGSIPTVFYNNEEVNAISEYTYDAVYRLTAATGREHIAQADIGAKDNWDDASFNLGFGGTSPTDPLTLRNYTQHYIYDSVGNILQMQHIAGTGSWKRKYRYATENNRLLETTVGDNTYRYLYHEQHGFITDLPHLTKMQWNFKEELQATSIQSRNTGTPETTYYVYDGNGQRIRKITENEADEGHVPTKKNERIYLGSFEVYREYMAGETNLERQTLHVSDTSGRIALIETRTLGDDGTEEKLVRYQLNNHLGSACLEVDDSEAVRVISYEEYHPYGTTAYQAVNSQIRSAAKRYRYTGMERDDETGLEYHRARYYITWLGRWLNTDPGGLVDGVNLYRYARGNPINLSDKNGMDPPEDNDEITNQILEAVEHAITPPQQQPITEYRERVRVFIHDYPIISDLLEATGLYSPPYNTDISYNEIDAPVLGTTRGRSAQGEAYPYVGGLSLLFAHDLADNYGDEAGSTFIRLIMGLARESGGTFAHTPSNYGRRIGGSRISYAFGVFQFEPGTWNNVIGSSPSSRGSSAFEEIFLPMRFYAGLYEGFLQRGMDPDMAARGVFLWHAGVGYQNSWLSRADALISRGRQPNDAYRQAYRDLSMRSAVRSAYLQTEINEGRLLNCGILPSRADSLVTIPPSSSGLWFLQSSDITALNDVIAPYIGQYNLERILFQQRQPEINIPSRRSADACICEGTRCYDIY